MRSIAPSYRCRAGSSCKSEQVLGVKGQESHAVLVGRIVTASIAAVCLCITKPALADLGVQEFPVRHGPTFFPMHGKSADARQSGAASTVTVDRAWLESLLLDEVGSRIKGLSDKEIMAMLEQLVRSRQPGSSTRSAGGEASQGMSSPLQGRGLIWPWAQRPAPELQSGPSSTGDAVLDRIASSLPGWLRGSDNAAPDDSAASRQPTETGSAPSPVDNSPIRTQDAQTSSGEDVPLEPPEGILRGTEQQGKQQPMPEPQMRSDEAAPSRTSSSVRNSSAATGEESMVGDMAKLAAQDRAADDADGPGAREEADLTGSLLEASGLPLRLREDGLPEASTAAVNGQNLNGSAILERARQVAGSAAAAAAAAIASGVQSLPADNPLQGLLSGRDGGLPPIIETALQLALVAGVGVGIYTMLRLLGLGDMDGSGAEDRAARITPSLPTQQLRSPQPSSQVDRAPSAWDILKLVPNTLLGLPVSISRPSATAAFIIPQSPHTSEDQGVPVLPPRGPPPAYSSSTSPNRMSGLGSAGAQQPDSTILWQREKTPDGARQPAQLAGSAAADSILWVRSEAGQTQRAGARTQSEVPPPDGTVLWRRHDTSAPASLTFPGRSGSEQRAGEPGFDGESQGRNDVLQPSSSEVDPWRAPQQPLSEVVPHDATAEDWIKLHAALQPRGEDPWRDPPSGPTQMAQPGSRSPGQSHRMELSAAAARAHDRTEYNNNGAASGVGQAGGQDIGRRKERVKVRVRDKSVLYNNVERVPPARQQAAYIRK